MSVLLYPDGTEVDLSGEDRSASRPGVTLGSPAAKDDPLRWAWEFDGRSAYVYSTDALPAKVGGNRAQTLLVRAHVPHSPPSTVQMAGIGTSIYTGIAIQSGGAALVGQNNATANTWFSPTGSIAPQTYWCTYVFREDATGANAEQAWNRYFTSGTTSQVKRSTATKYGERTPTGFGIGARVYAGPTANLPSSFRCAEVVWWERYLSDDELDHLANGGRGADIALSNPAVWVRPAPGRSSIGNMGYLGGTFQSGAGAARPLIVRDGPDHKLETFTISEVARQSTSETTSNEVLQGLAIGASASYGSGAWNGGVGGASRYLHKYTGTAFTPHEDSDGPLGSGIYELLTATVTGAGTVDHAGDLAYIPSSVTEVTYQDRIAVPYLHGSGSGHGVIALFNPATMATTNAWRPDTLFASTNYGYLDSVCYWYREKPYSGTEEGLVAGSLRRIFCADYHETTPAILWEESVDGTYGLPQGLVQLGIPSCFLASIGFGTGAYANGFYEFDMWAGTLRAVRRWVPPVPPAGHYEGIELAADLSQIWQGESTNAVRYTADQLNYSRDASIYRPGA